MSFNCNNLNMLGMNNLFSMNGLSSGMFGGNMLSSLFSGTGSIFGGYNMFGSSGCSLFTNCNGSYNYNAMAGFGVGMTLMNLAFAALPQIITNKRENTPQNIKADIEGIQDSIDAELDKLGKDVRVDNYTTYNPKEEAWYKEGLADIKSRQLDATVLKDCKTTIENYTKLENELLGSSTTDERKEEIRKQLETQKKDKELAEEKIKAHEKAVEDEKALQAKLAKRQEEVKASQERIEDLLDKLNNANSVYEDNLLDEADGSRVQRSSAKRFDEVMNGEKSVRKADVRYAILGYKNAKTDAERNEWAEKFKKLYEQLSENEKDDKTLDTAYGIICG